MSRSKAAWRYNSAIAILAGSVFLYQLVLLVAAGLYLLAFFAMRSWRRGDLSS